MDAASYRTLFPLDSAIAFLNHGSFGACPLAVLEARNKLQLRLEREPVDFLVRQGPALFKQAREEMAEFVGAGSDELVFVTNATTGVNILLRSLPLDPGDEVLSLDHEYGACDRAWEAEVKRRSIVLRKESLGLPRPDDATIVTQVEAAIGSRTRVLYLSHITSPTALQLPLEQLARLGKKYGLFVMVDGAHGPGHVPLALHALGVDAYAGNAHKWLMGPKGTGFLYLREEHHGWIEPLVTSWGSLEHNGGSRLVSELEWAGTFDPTGVLSLATALRFRREQEWDAACAERRGELKTWLANLCARRGWTPLDPEESRLQMAAFRLPDLDEDRLHKRLYLEYGVEVPVHRFRNWSLLRVSYQPYNDRKELQWLGKALELLLPGDTVPAGLARRAPAGGHAQGEPE